MHEREIYTTDFDMDRLRQLLEGGEAMEPQGP
jgi:hypothetical protein